MKKLFIVCCLATLGGCTWKPMPAKQMAASIAECEALGLDYVQEWNEFVGVVGISCRPPSHKTNKQDGAEYRRGLREGSAFATRRDLSFLKHEPNPRAIEALIKATQAEYIKGVAK